MLRAEPLEGRTMLSAAAPTTSSLLQALQIHGPVSDKTFLPVVEGPIFTLMPLEGGFVFSQHGAADADGAAPFSTSVFRVDASIGELLSLGNLDSADATAAVWSNYDALEIGGLIPRTIPAEKIVPDPPSQSVTIRETSAPASKEGGMIPIVVIPAPLEEIKQATGEAELASSSSPSQTPVQAELTALSQTSDAKSPAREIYGEWARAAVFEIAGGEPVAERFVGKPRVPTAASAPLSSAQSPVRDTASSESSPPSTATVAPAAHDSAAIQLPSSNVAIPFVSLGGISQLLLLEATPVNEPAPVDGAADAPAGALPQEVLEAAFEQVGNGELAIASSSTDRLRLQSWLSGTPLLLLFALERVAVRNRRRNRAGETAVQAVLRD
jgi:hypothetical protein